jgi:hypothetical protein
MTDRPPEYVFEDLEAVKKEFLVQCGICDFGILGACNCPERDYRSTMDNLVRELEWRRSRESG